MLEYLLWKIKWLLENSWGNDSGYKGFLIMTDDWFQEYGNACIDFLGRITISPERPEDSVSYWSIRNNFAKQIESELTREGLTYADSKYWTERHRRISQRTRDYFRQQREEVVNGNN